MFIDGLARAPNIFRHGHQVEIPAGCRVVYSPDRPICGAKVWIETLYDVKVISWD